MRNWIYILTFFLIATNLFGQDSDIIESLKTKFEFTEYDKLQHVVKFNKDTILVAGYISNPDTSLKNVIYQTTNKGISWEKYYFNGDAWIYNVYFEKNGNIWMGGSDNYIHFSSDYGKNWIKKPEPFKPLDRVLSIFMKDSLSGIAGGLSNGLAITFDNWKTTKQISTPLDSKKYSISENSSRNNIKKVQFIDSIILINQNDHIYFSNINEINWKEFNIPVRDFEVNKISNNFKLFSLREKVYIINPKLCLIESYLEKDIKNDKILSDYIELNISSFLNSEIKLIKVKAGRFDSKKSSGGFLNLPIYKENIQSFKTKNKDKISIIKNILEAKSRFSEPSIGNFNFKESDIKDYNTFYQKKIEERNEDALWGTDFSYQYKLENENFLNPKLVLENITQQMIKSVFYNNMHYPSFFNNEDYINIELINDKSEILKISSENSSLFSLPWTLEYNGIRTLSYDTRITEFIKTLIRPNTNYYNKLSSGELIYKLIEEKIYNEIEYKNGY